VSALDCWTDDTFYQSTVPALQWLATISHTQGLIASAQEELDPFPSWFIFAFNRRPYMLSNGSTVPFNEDDPPPSARPRRSSGDTQAGTWARRRAQPSWLFRSQVCHWDGVQTSLSASTGQRRLERRGTPGRVPIPGLPLGGVSGGFWVAW
jgi:hypothetical protein